MKIPCVAAILWNPCGKVLLQQRESTPGLEFAGWWTLPGGKVEEGESPEEAIRRELVEEIELKVPLTLWRVYERPHSESVTVVQYIYVGQTDRKVSSLALNEGQALRYCDVEGVVELPVGYGFDLLLEAFFAQIGEEADFV